MGINYKKLNPSIKDKESKDFKAFDSDIFLSSYIALISQMGNKIQDMSQHELGLYVKSLDTWLNKRNKNNKCDEDVKIGDIFMIDWNINYKPELSYFHPGLIIGLSNEMVLVIPTSSKEKTIDQAYHPIINSTGDWFNRKVDKSDGFDEECVLLLDNLKSISKTRLLNKVGQLTCDLKTNDVLYQEIKNTLIENLFPHEFNMYIDMKNELEREKHAKAMIQHENDRLYNEYMKVKVEYEKLFNTSNNNSN
jgi:hypothetical protein